MQLEARIPGIAPLPSSTLDSIGPRSSAAPLPDYVNFITIGDFQHLRAELSRFAPSPAYNSPFARRPLASSAFGSLLFIINNITRENWAQVEPAQDGGSHAFRICAILHKMVNWLKLDIEKLSSIQIVSIRIARLPSFSPPPKRNSLLRNSEPNTF